MSQEAQENEPKDKSCLLENTTEEGEIIAFPPTAGVSPGRKFFQTFFEKVLDKFDKIVYHYINLKLFMEAIMGDVLLQEAKSLAPYLQDIFFEIHKNPELGKQEYKTQALILSELEKMGIQIKYHHPEVGAAGQFEIEPMLGQMSKMADASMMIKYVIHNTAAKHGQVATFMPKPVYGEAGNGMHVHMLLLKDGEPVFSDDNGYSHLSKEAHYFMGGLLKHIASLCALTNPSTNSFKRLVPGFEAPVTVGYATSNRSAVIRIPAYAKSPELRRFELRNPDATCNPYFLSLIHI